MPSPYEAPVVCAECGDPASENDPVYRGATYHLGCAPTYDALMDCEGHCRDAARIEEAVELLKLVVVAAEKRAQRIRQYGPPEREPLQPITTAVAGVGRG